VRPYVVSHLNAKATQLATGGDLLLREKSRNVHRIAGLLIKCSGALSLPIKCNKSLLILQVS
jgi:hypothetical protein